MKSTQLYTGHPEGPVHLDFDPKTHRYWAREGESPRLRVVSATSVTGLASTGSQGLVIWAAGAACQRFRSQLDVFRPTDSQIEAARKALANGDSLENVLARGFRFDPIWVEQVSEEAKWAHRRLSNEAKNIGSAVHDFAERWILHQLGKGSAPAMPANEAARAGASAFLDWAHSHEIEFHWTERKVYSRDGRYAGTADLGITFEGVKGVADFKTSKAVYESHHWQTAAYLGALREELGEEWVGRWIIHLDKRTGEFGVYESPKSLDEDLGVFRSLRDAHLGIKGY